MSHACPTHAHAALRRLVRTFSSPAYFRDACRYVCNAFGTTSWVLHIFCLQKRCAKILHFLGPIANLYLLYRDIFHFLASLHSNQSFGLGRACALPAAVWFRIKENSHVPESKHLLVYMYHTCRSRDVSFSYLRENR